MGFPKADVLARLWLRDDFPRDLFRLSPVEGTLDRGTNSELRMHRGTCRRAPARSAEYRSPAQLGLCPCPGDCCWSTSTRRWAGKLPGSTRRPATPLTSQRSPPRPGPASSRCAPCACTNVTRPSSATSYGAPSHFTRCRQARRLRPARHAASPDDTSARPRSSRAGQLIGHIHRVLVDSYSNASQRLPGIFDAAQNAIDNARSSTHAQDLAPLAAFVETMLTDAHTARVGLRGAPGYAGHTHAPRNHAGRTWRSSGETTYVPPCSKRDTSPTVTSR